MLDVLRRQGLTDVEFLTITARGPTWADRAQGFDAISFPVLEDREGRVYTAFGASPYDVILIDKQGRLVTTERLSEETVDFLNRKLRDLHAEP